MRAIVCLAFLLAPSLFAADPADADRAAIRVAIRLEIAIPVPVVVKVADGPLSGDFWPYWPSYLHRPESVEIGAIRFVDQQVAAAEANTDGRPLLVILKKTHGVWKIFSVHPLQTP